VSGSITQKRPKQGEKAADHSEKQRVFGSDPAARSALEKGFFHGAFRHQFQVRWW